MMLPRNLADSFDPSIADMYGNALVARLLSTIETQARPFAYASIAIAEFHESIGIRKRILMQPHRCAPENDKPCKFDDLPGHFCNHAENGVVLRFPWNGNSPDVLRAKPLAFLVKPAENLQAMACLVHEHRQRIGVLTEHFNHFKAYVITVHRSVHRLDKNIRLVLGWRWFTKTANHENLLE